MVYQAISKILTEQLVPALGCTDPAGIAFCAAVAAEYAEGNIEKIHGAFSGNLIKNVAAVTIPGSGGLCGAKLAMALGAVCGNPDKKLEVLEGITPQQVAEAASLEDSGKVTVSLADSDSVLYMQITVTTDRNTATATVKDGYTDIKNITVNGREILEEKDCHISDCEGLEYDLLDLKNIIDFADNAELELMRQAEKAIEMNEELARAGLEKGAGAGCIIRERMAGADCSNNLAYSASMLAAAGVDARMAGYPLPAMSNTGSGNQGIVCTMPVVGAARAIAASWDRTVRATALSCLISIYIKKRIGPLSTVCGCVVAGTGAACGIAYLKGGGRKELLDAMKNMFGNVAGLICDGAKASCALKAATCINAACMASELAMAGFGLDHTNGIVGREEADTIDYFVRTSKEGLSNMDGIVLDIIMNKK